MSIKEVIRHLEQIAPPDLQESYDNAGLVVGSSATECKGILVSLDVTEAVVAEAIRKNCNLIVAHHPVIFKGLKKINGTDYVERTVIAAIKNDIAIYAIHTNLDNVLGGVNKKVAEKLGLQDCKTLVPKANTLEKLVTFVPLKKAEEVRKALFSAGAGAIGNYDECSFNVDGSGTFRAGEDSHPFVGSKGERHLEPETRIEMVFPAYFGDRVIRALKQAHPYEEVAYYVQALQNKRDDIGSGLVGRLPEPVSETAVLDILQSAFHLSVVRHSPFLDRPVEKIAVCGGAGIFLLPAAIASGAQVYITGDIKYHEFFDADGKLFLADIGHYESEQYTVELLTDVLQNKFSNFAVQKTEIDTNPVRYFTGKHGKTVKN